MIRIGLTGNMGCGKSSVARMFADLGADVIDADAVVHEMLAEGGAAVSRVLAVFPEAATTGSEAVDRSKLAAIVFADPAKRRFLEALLHPLVWQRTRELMDDAEARGATMAITEATLLFEAARGGGPDPRTRFDTIVVVTCDPAVQIERILARMAPGATGQAHQDRDRATRARIAVQMPQDEKARLADHVIDNSGSAEETRRQVVMLHSALLGGKARDIRT